VTLQNLRWAAASLAIIAIPILAAGCDDSPTSPTPSFSQADVRAGTGAIAAIGNTVSVNYTGWLFDSTKTDQKGLQFDSSVGREPFTFTIGSGQVIRGWDQGVPGMQVGGIRRLVIPPSLAYGASRSGPIPPNATLVFEIELLSIQ
jgi:FKBP-type peptidyl-prolyl cis-trans isomerase FkpA